VTVSDVDVVFEFASYLSRAGLELAQRLDVPYLVEVEGPLAKLRYESGASPFRAGGDSRLSAQLGAAAAVVTVSTPLADHLEGLGARRDRIVVAPNVADPSLFVSSHSGQSDARDELEISRSAFVVGFHGVFSPWYALPSLVRAVGEMQSTEAVVLLVGDGVDREAIMAEARTRNVGVVVTGFVAQRDASRLIQAADVGAVPDHAWWTSPLKLFEFGALGIPVVGASVPSIRAVAKNDEVALFDPAEPTALSRALDRLAQNPEERARLGATWQRTVLNDYTLDALRSNLDRALRLAIS
jgi:glycosyltransferase involved in cell wall biosynthesis